jgi:hypothetical protein
MQTEFKFIFFKLLTYNLAYIQTKCYIKPKKNCMNKYGCCLVHHATKMCKFEKKRTKMVNVYSLLVLVREEEIPYSSGTPPTITILPPPP